MKRRTVTIGILAGILVPSLFLIILSVRRETRSDPIPSTPQLTPSFSEPTTVLPSPEQVSPLYSDTTTPSANLPNLLAGDNFPSEVIEYPKDWLAELVFPRDFELVQANSGEFPKGGSLGWAVKLLYAGSIVEASDALAVFFVKNNWKVVHKSDLAEAGMVIIIEREGGRGSGIVSIAPDLDKPSRIRVFATIFP